MKKLKVLSAALLLLAFSTANADMVSGGITITGAWTPIVNVGDDVSVANAIGIDFMSDAGRAVATSGDFATYIFGDALFGDIVAMQDFLFDPFTAVDPLWSAGGFSFKLENIVVDKTDAAAGVLNLFGTGTITGNGYEATVGTWSLSTTSADTTFGWTSSTVPEPASLALMGLGLLGLGVVSRRRRS